MVIPVISPTSQSEELKAHITSACNEYNSNEIDIELGELGPTLGAKYTVDHFIEIIKRNDTKIISLLHLGEDGLLKTLDFCPLNEEHLRSILECGERCDGSSIFPNLGIPASSSDIVLRPKLETAFFDPFTPVEKSVLCIFCWHYGSDGMLLSQSPETILHRAEEELAKRGHILWAHTEVEYFVGKEVRNDQASDQIKSDRGYHAISPYVFGQELRREAISILSKLGVHVKYGHSENGYISGEKSTWEQHEIELALEPLNKAARSTVLTKWVLTSLAEKYKMKISFDPICQKGHIGSGLHVHMSPRYGHGPNDYSLIRDEETNALSSEAVHLIAGLSQLGGALMAFGNRTETSFIRLNQGKEAPSTVCWGDRNRHALIRLPLVAKNEEGSLVAPPTIEFRLGDGSAHPYLLIAGLAMSMLYGLDMDGQDALALVAATESKSKDVPAQQDKDLASNDNASAMDTIRFQQRSVPRTRKDVTVELNKFRKAFQDSGVFPVTMIDAILRNAT